MGWLTGWAYRKVLLIDPSEDGEQSDYQLNLAVCKAATTSVSTSPYATSGGSEGQSPYTGHAWVDPANSYSDTLTFSSITSGFDTGDLSEVLINKGYANLANAYTVSAKTIPVHATIKGIKVTIYRKYAVSIVRDALVQLSKDGGTTGAGDNKASTDDWPLASTAKVYGSSADLWGTTWTPAEINSANFGIRVAAQAMGDGAQAYISFIAISVYYNLVDCADLVAADFDDLRFTANDGTTLLSYFIERVYSGSAFVWVKIPTIAASPAQTTIYMYYSGTETAVSSVADTFGTGLADDFEHGSDEQDVSASGGNITWSQGNSGGNHAGKIDTAAYYGGTRGLRLYGSEFVYFTKAGAAGYAIRFMLRKADNTLFTFGHGNATKALVLYVDAYREIMYVTTSNQHLSPAQYINLSVFYSIELNNINFDAGTFDICRDVSPWWPEGKIKTGATMKATSAYQNLIKMTVSVTLNNWIDNILIRKFTPNEPAWASFGDPVYIVPIVTTQAGTELGKDSFTANGNITNADGGYTRRGFCYIEGAIGDPSTEDAVVFEDIESFDTGAYSELVSGLSIDTAYRVRAYVTNDMGTSYGDSVTVITTIDATYVEILTSDRALALDNTTAFTPDADYEPATKKYVDDAVEGAGDMQTATYDTDIDGVVDKAEGVVTGTTLPGTASDGELFGKTDSKELYIWFD